MFSHFSYRIKISQERQGKTPIVEEGEPARTGQSNSGTAIEQRLLTPTKRGLEEASGTEPATKKARFFELQDELVTYELDKTMADYANKQMDIFQPNNSILEHILKDNPVPSNIKKAIRIWTIF